MRVRRTILAAGVVPTLPLVLCLACESPRGDFVLSPVAGAPLEASRGVGIGSRKAVDIGGGTSAEEQVREGGTGALFLPGAPSWGLDLDFAFSEPVTDPGGIAGVDGRWSGGWRDGCVPVRDFVRDLHAERGHDTLTLTAVHRWSPDRFGARRFLDSLEPYLGAGVGAAIPHVHATTGASHADAYRFAGPVVRGLVGVRIDLGRSTALWAEYDVSHAWLDDDLLGAGSTRFDALTHQVFVGAELRF